MPSWKRKFTPFSNNYNFSLTSPFSKPFSHGSRATPQLYSTLLAPLFAKLIVDSHTKQHDVGEDHYVAKFGQILLLCWHMIWALMTLLSVLLLNMHTLDQSAHHVSPTIFFNKLILMKDKPFRCFLIKFSMHMHKWIWLYVSSTLA